MLSTPICNDLVLTRLAKSPSALINPSTLSRLKQISMISEETLNPSQLEGLKSALSSNLTLIQAPTGTNKILTIVEIIKDWLNYSQLQILVYSKNKTNLEYVHVSLIKQGINSLYLSEDQEVNKGLSSPNMRDVLTEIGKASFFANPASTNPGTMKAILEEFKVVCCGTEEILSDNLKSTL